MAAVMGFLVADRLPATYESEATLLVGPVSGDRDTLQASGTQARTYAGIAETATILNEAARRAGLTPSGLKSKVDVTASDITRLITVRARDGNAVRASEIANSIARELVAYSRRQGLVTPPEGTLQIVELAVPSTDEIGPSKDLILPLAAIAGLLGALGLAAFVDSLSTVVRSEEELSAVAPVAVLGSVDGAGRGLSVDAPSDSGAATAYRLLAAKIELWNGKSAPRSIVVVDARGGRSSVSFAANLAGALSEGGSTVALVDDGERGDAARFFGYSDDSAAEGDALVRRARPLRAGQVTLDRFRVKRSRLTILRLRNSSEPLELETPTEVLRQLQDDADVVVVTVPPLERSSNSLVWSRAAEATILVTERDHTRREQIPGDVESLRRVGANVIGAVLYTNRGF